MPLEKESHVTGAEYLVVMCDDLECHNALGPKHLVQTHQGYESSGYTPITREQVDAAIVIAVLHEQQHPDHKMRLIHFKAEEHE